ncbi:hypothetical protein, partial [Paenibacillus cisolokensis]|uniref:hypothetical protein n=1 Tax=Paenibacillus cisolokensis TaxID=1658519 RepID=UPI001BD01076
FRYPATQCFHRLRLGRDALAARRPLEQSARAANRSHSNALAARRPALKPYGAHGFISPGVTPQYLRNTFVK